MSSNGAAIRRARVPIDDRCVAPKDGYFLVAMWEVVGTSMHMHVLSMSLAVLEKINYEPLEKSDVKSGSTE